MANDKLVLDLKNIKPAQFVNTQYNNSTSIDNVVIQALPGDRIKIFLNGANIASSKVILDTRNEALSSFSPALPEVQHEAPKSMPVNETTASVETAVNNNETASLANVAVPKAALAKTPVLSQNQEASEPIKTYSSPKTNQYTPIYIDLSKEASSVNNSVEKVKSVTPIIAYDDRNVESYSKGTSELGGIFTASPLDWALRLGMLAMIIVGGFKLFAKPKNIEIPLATASAKPDDKNIYKSVEMQKEILTKSLGLPARREGLAQKTSYSSLSSYGLREYQNSQLPPKGMSHPLPERKLNSDLLRSNANITANTAVNMPSKPKVRQEKITRKQTEDAQTNFDGVKFLETMATIYQKSGRTDLAAGIRQNIIKKQQAA
ncbi:MAG: hypothetical protein GX568_00160 [Candidatus Gastranaerophilales bacterium]|nr:hypothetical protein [Candidatus Gastranaerophilales bacterium]